MRIVWVGFHLEGLSALEVILREGIRVEGVLTLAAEYAAKRSGAVSYRSLCCEFEVPLFEIRHINDAEAIGILHKLDPDVVFVIGWSQLVGPEALRVPKFGMIGAHAALLPQNRGSAPINWAIINGETETGNTLMWLAEGVDEGDIIDQMKFPITPFDTCETLYQRVAETNKIMILRTLQKLLAGKRPCFKQAHTNEPVLPRRRPQDGLIDWSKTSKQIYDFVRALTRPYPGAFTFLDRRIVMVWKAALLPDVTNGEKAGEIVGSIVSPVDQACGIVVKCGRGHVLLLEVEHDGIVLQGQELATSRLDAKVFSNE